MNLKEDILLLYNENWNRKIKENEDFRPFFKIYIGENDDYVNLMATIIQKVEDHKELSLFYQNQIKLNKEKKDMWQHIQQILKQINLIDIENENVVFHQDEIVNKKIKKALNLILKKIEILKEKEILNNQIDFLTYLILNIVFDLKNIDFYRNICPKCIWYGEIEKKDILYLSLLNQIGFDILYFNNNKMKEEEIKEKFSILDFNVSFELKEENNQIDFTKILQKTPTTESENFEILKNSLILNQIDTVVLRKSNEIKKDFFEYKELGKPIYETISTSSLYKKEIQENLLKNTNILWDKWELKKKKIKNNFLTCDFSEVVTNTHNEVRYRNGFLINEEYVVIPNYIFLIEGEKEIDPQNTFFQIKKEESILLINNNIEKLLKEQNLKKDKEELIFFIDKENNLLKDVKCSSLYGLSKYNASMEKFILETASNVLKEMVIKYKLSKKEKVDFIFNIINLSDDIYLLIENWNYAAKSPNFIVFLEEKTSIEKETILLLNFFYKLGLDIIIFSPAGMSMLDNFDIRYEKQRMDKLNYNRKIVDLFDLEINKQEEIKKTNSFFGSLFGKMFK